MSSRHIYRWMFNVLKCEMLGDNSVVLGKNSSVIFCCFETMRTMCILIYSSLAKVTFCLKIWFAENAWCVILSILLLISQHWFRKCIYIYIFFLIQEMAECQQAPSHSLPDVMLIEMYDTTWCTKPQWIMVCWRHEVWGASSIVLVKISCQNIFPQCWGEQMA